MFWRALVKPKVHQSTLTISDFFFFPLSKTAGKKTFSAVAFVLTSCVAFFFCFAYRLQSSPFFDFFRRQKRERERLAYTHKRTGGEARTKSHLIKRKKREKKTVKKLLRKRMERGWNERCAHSSATSQI